jgi:Fe-S-cluster containining protein
VFAVTLAEAVLWAQAIAVMPAERRASAERSAGKLLAEQSLVFAEVAGPPDVAGARDEELFSARLSRLNARHPACPLLFDDLCGVYAHRPLLCRAYGFPVDAYAVRGRDALVFRSLCVLYEGHQLTDYVRARDLKDRLSEISRRLAGGKDWGRFTSPEAILARLTCEIDFA